MFTGVTAAALPIMLSARFDGFHLSHALPDFPRNYPEHVRGNARQIQFVFKIKCNTSQTCLIPRGWLLENLKLMHGTQNMWCCTTASQFDPTILRNFRVHILEFESNGCHRMCIQSSNIYVSYFSNASTCP